MKTFFCAICLAWALSSAAFAIVKPAPLFTDHAVLQQDQPVPVWGTADPGEEVTVRFAGQEQRAKADANGRWKIVLAPLAGGSTGTLSITGNNAIELGDILVGEVWLCSGQSNMAFPMGRTHEAERDMAAAENRRIRMFIVRPSYQGAPQENCEGRWVVCTPEAVKRFSAVAYFFGLDLATTLQRPVGLIVSAVGGTAIELWTSEEALKTLPEYPGLKAKAGAAGRELANEGPADPSEKRAREKLQKKAFGTGGLFNGMIAPLVPYALRGAIWYQGEANDDDSALRYDVLLETLVTDWRKRWNQDFPFGWVQLPEFRQAQTEPGETGRWPILREKMLQALRIPDTGMAVTLGLGEASDIHPRNKKDVGNRLARWALDEVYGRETPWGGPLPKSHAITGNEIVVEFSHADGGLAAKGGKLEGFAIAGSDRKWVWANARIDGNRVIASNPEVPKPVALRYAWADNPVFSLFSGAGLPASPFRTDEFPPHQKPAEEKSTVLAE